jgi:bifunctional non-homologous end joining protein LigD
MGLAEYRRKRDFRQTPEPAGRARPSGQGLQFVVQRHAARRLHYDFRLELDGVLKSWAVPKGPSLDPATKSLAVEVEDHPAEYGGFEGVIPEGEYGGGTVMLFDRGQWEPLNDARKGLRNGKLKFRLFGERLQGDWTLVRTSRNRNGAKSDWLLIKGKDEHAQPDDDHQHVNQFDRSVATGRTMSEIASAADRIWSGKSEGEKAKAKNGNPRRQKKVRPSSVLRPEEIPGARRKPLPASIQPEMATLVSGPPQGDEWLHELKLDGYRLIAIKHDGTVRLLTRRGNDWTDRFPTVAKAVEQLPAEQLVLDGEVVIIASDGTTDFQALQNSLTAARFRDHVYFLFDVMYCNGYDLRPSPLEARKQFLAQFLAQFATRDSTLRYSDHVRGQGEGMFHHACRYAVEGIVSKRADSPYVSRRTRDWLKMKCLKRQEFVIGGFSKPQGSRHHFGALLLGYYNDQDELIYCGKVGTGFTHQSLAEMSNELGTRRTDQKPFAVGPPRPDARGVTWVRPEVVVEIEFADWTDDGRLRQGSFQGIREDKEPQEVRREVPAGRSGRDGKREPEHSRVAESPRREPRSKSSVPATNGRIAGIRITHPDKILYTEQEVAKIDLARYYERVADWILPHVLDRPLSLVRCPQGRKGTCFFQKHVGDSMPQPIRSIEVEEKSGIGHYVSIDDVAGLITLVQLGVLEIHPWGSRKDKLDQPDRLVFDLDPGEDVEWSAVVEAAHQMRALLEELDLQSFVRTTGGKGLHVVVPMTRRAAWPEAKQFAKDLARHLEHGWPERYIAISTRAKRRGKIFVDYLRNDRGATAVASYSTRARAGATVATPLDWDELTPDVRSDQYHVGNIPDRLAALKAAPWSDFFQVRQSLTKSKLLAVRNP